MCLVFAELYWNVFWFKLNHSNFQQMALGEVGEEPYGCTYHFVLSIVWTLLLL